MIQCIQRDCNNAYFVNIPNWIVGVFWNESVKCDGPIFSVRI